MASLLLTLARRIKATGIVSRRPLLASCLKGCYGVALKVLYGRRGVPIALGRDLFRVAVASRTLVSSYDGERVVFDALTHRIRDRMILFDVGANEGVFTLWAARRIGPKGKVVSFEPAPEAVRLLKQNIRLNDLDSRVDVVPKLASDGCGWEQIYVSGKSGYNSQSMEAAPRDASPILVEAISLDMYVDAAGLVPDIVKIDVEGAEFRVLRGMERILNRADVFVLAEIHPAALKLLHATEADILTFIENMGYRIYDVQMRRIGTLQQHVVFAKETTSPCATDARAPVPIAS